MTNFTGKVEWISSDGAVHEALVADAETARQLEDAIRQAGNQGVRVRMTDPSRARHARTVTDPWAPVAERSTERHPAPVDPRARLTPAQSRQVGQSMRSVAPE